MTSTTTTATIESYVAWLDEFRGHPYGDREYTQYVYGATTPGPKFTRVFCRTQTKLADGSWQDNPGRSVHAFVENTTGDIYQADGWKRASKVRMGNIADYQA